MFQQLTTKAFIDVIRDNQMQQSARMGRHMQPSNSLANAQDFEAKRQAARGAHQIKYMKVHQSEEQNDKTYLKETLLKLVLELSSINQSPSEILFSAGIVTRRDTPVQIVNPIRKLG